MIRRNQLLWVSVSVLVFSLCSAQTKPEKLEKYTDPEAYKVLSAAITIRYAGKARDEHFTIFNETRTLPQIATWRHSFEKPEHLRMWLALADEYDKVNKHPLLLLRKFDLPKDYEFTAVEGLALDEHRDPGNIFVSAVAFNDAKTLALISIENYCGISCGSQTTLLLEKKGDSWQKVEWRHAVVETEQ